jgi:hypothetical protein
VSPPLPLNFAAAQLLKSDIEIRTAVTPRYDKKKTKKRNIGFIAFMII